MPTSNKIKSYKDVLLDNHIDNNSDENHDSTFDEEDDNNEDVPLPCSRCQKIGPTICGEPSGSIVLRNDGYYVDCGYYSSSDMETYKFDCFFPSSEQDQWMVDAMRKQKEEEETLRRRNKKRRVHVAICDKCIDRYCLLNTLSLFSSPWRKTEHSEGEEKNLRRQSESHTFNYKTYWECGSNDWKRRKSL
jgi:hypothetical protein